VIDATDGSILDGLTREVEEETGLRVRDWVGPIYEVRAVAEGLGWAMRCEVYVAGAYDGDLRIEDPDGIVVDAAFVPFGECGDHLAACHPWVREPLAEWIETRFTDRRDFAYELLGNAIASIQITRQTHLRRAR
jgi:8-oxo-dGTP pyrophosphatase MutT (NUDIX family)